MAKIFLGGIILFVSIACAVFLYVWISRQSFDDWFSPAFLYAAVTFLLALCIVLAGLLFESGRRDCEYCNKDRD